MSVEVRIEQLAHAKGLPLPAYETSGSVGLDLRAAIAENETLQMPSGKRLLVPTGLRIALPTGFEAQIRSRSGLALKFGIIVPNSPGTIDSDYRGEVHVILANLGDETFEVMRGMRIAQLVLARVEKIVWRQDPVNALETVRGSDGFGSTGVLDIGNGD